MSNYTYFNHSLSWGGGGWDNDLDLIFLWKQDDQRLNRYHHLLILSVWLCKIFMHFWILQEEKTPSLIQFGTLWFYKIKIFKYKYICIYNKLFISHFFINSNNFRSHIHSKSIKRLLANLCFSLYLFSKL